MPSMKPSNANHDPKDPVVIPEPKIPFPLATRHGGLGAVVSALAGYLLVGAGKEYHELAHPGLKDHFLRSTEKGVEWSEFKLTLLGDAKLDQSLHTKAKPVFAGLGISSDSEGTSWLCRKNSKDDYSLSIDNNCIIDQDLSTKAAVEFESVDANFISVDFVKLLLTKASAEEAGAGTIAMTKDGACMSNGKVWRSLHGNIHGRGDKHSVAMFNDDAEIMSCHTLQYVKGMLGIGLVEPEYCLHVDGEAKFNNGIILGELSEKSSVASIGLVGGNVGFKCPNGFMVFGSGDGNLLGSGKKHHLAMFTDTEELRESPFKFIDGDQFFAPKMLTKILKTEAVGFETLSLYEKDSKLFMGDREISATIKRGKLSCNFGKIEGSGYLIDSDLEIKAALASDTERGIASFDSSYFTTENGHVKINWEGAPHALDGFGLISKKDFLNFRDKAAAFSTGEISQGEGIEIKGCGKAFGDSISIKALRGDYKNAGIVQLGERDFIFKDGVAFLRYTPPTISEIKTVLEEKQNRLPISVATLGRGFLNDFSFGVIGNKDIKLDVNLASYETCGIAAFNRDQFSVDNGIVSARILAKATLENDGLMTPNHIQNIVNLNEYVAKCPQGKGELGTLTLWGKNGLESAKDFENLNDGLRYSKALEVDSLRVTKTLRLGTCELSAEDTGAGVMRYERGCLEISNGTEWVRLRAGGLIGEGKEGTFAFWTDANSLSAPKSLFWNEEKSCLGIGISDPLTQLHIQTAKAGVRIVDTRSSCPQNGANLYLGTDDGQELGLSDTLARIVLGSRKGVGASIRAFAAGNWDSNSAPTSLALGTTPDGQISPIDHLFLSSNGYLGIDIAKPLAPFHVKAQNKFDISAMFEGSIRIGGSDASATDAGKGCLKYENGSLCISNGITWSAVNLQDLGV